MGAAPTSRTPIFSNSFLSEVASKTAVPTQYTPLNFRATLKKYYDENRITGHKTSLGASSSIVLKAKALCYKPEVAGSRPDEVNEFFQFT
jgi:hypothetical protein